MASANNIANRLPITGALMLATLMNTIDGTIANVALPHIQGSISASREQVFWVLTSYIIGAAIMTPLSGWLSLKVGRKTMFLFSIGGFTIASMLCGVATSLPEIVFYRVLQGVAGAAVMPLSQATMLDLYPQHMVPRVMSLWSAAVILGPIFGPTLGGWLTEHLSWRWVFFINLPIGILAFAAVWIFMDNDDAGQQRPFDFLGFGAIVIFITSFQILLDRGPGEGWFESIEIWVEAAVAIAAFWVFIIHTLTAKNPFFHRDLAKDRNFVTTTFFGLFVGILLFSTGALMPSLMQNLLGYSALHAGEASVTRGIGSLISFLIVPSLITRIGPRSVLVGGLALSLLGFFQMAAFDLSMTSGPIMVSGFVQGMGMGLLFAPQNVLAYATLNPIHRTEGTIVSTMIRSLGSSAGISVIGAAVTTNNATTQTRLAERLVAGDPMLTDQLPAYMDPSTMNGLIALNAEVTRQAMMVSYTNVFSWMAVGVFCMVPLVLLLKPPPPMQLAPINRDAHAD